MMMNAWLLDSPHEVNVHQAPLRFARVPVPVPGLHEVLLRLSCCGVCHTEIDEIEGRTSPPAYPVIPGHQAIGVIESAGGQATRFNIGTRVGVAWIYSACGQCEYCSAGLENLCDAFKATGRDVNGGYSQYMLADERFVYPVPQRFSDEEAAPLLCAGAIGFRALRLTCLKNGESLGLMGFGSSAHLVIKIARHQFPNSKVFVFARSAEERAFSITLGAAWAGDVDEMPPSRLQAIIDTTPVWKPVIASLTCLRPGGKLVINAIRKENADITELLNLSYEKHLWLEKEIKSVANITREDVSQFLDLAASADIHPKVRTYPFENANEALTDLKFRKNEGSKVLICK